MQFAVISIPAVSAILGIMLQWEEVVVAHAPPILQIVILVLHLITVQAVKWDIFFMTMEAASHVRGIFLIVCSVIIYLFVHNVPMVIILSLVHHVRAARQS